MNHNNLKRKLRSQDNIKIRVNNKIKKKNSVNKPKSSNKCLKNKLKSETKINQIYIKELKIISNVFKNLNINEDKEFEDYDKTSGSFKHDQKPSLYMNGSNFIKKKTATENSATLDIINKIIEVNNESLQNSPINNICRKDSNFSNKNRKIKFLSKNYSFTKMDKKKRHDILSNIKRDPNLDDIQSPISKINTKLKKNSKKSFSESKNIDKNFSSCNAILKNKKSDKLLISESEKKINNNKRRNSNVIIECKKHPKNSYFNLQSRFQKNNKDGSPMSLFEHNEDKYFSSVAGSINDQGKNLLKNTIIHLGLSTIIDNKNNPLFTEADSIFKNSDKSNDKNNDIKSVRLKNDMNLSIFSKQQESTGSILGLDIEKLKKEIYEYENTEITDAINRLPTINHDNDIKTNSNNKKNTESLFNTKSLERKKSEKIKKINRKIKLNKERHRILQRKKYVYDSLDDEEYEEIEENNFYFEPDSIFIYTLDFIIFFTSFIELFYFPFYLAESFFYTGFSAKDILFYFTDIIFILDLIIGFFKAYYNFDEFLIKKSSSIIKNYAQNWFILDFLCCIPFYTILKSFKNKTIHNNYYLKSYFDYKGDNLYYILVLIKITKIFKVLSSNIFFKLIKNQLMKNSFINDWGNVLKYIFLFIAILNIGSSVYIFVARNSYPNWILDLGISNINFAYIYICSTYHFMTTITTIGYGDIIAKSITEKIFEIFSLMVGTCIYSWIITSASNYIQKMNEKYAKYEKNKEILNEIKVNYSLMNECLYDRIYRLLYYRKTHEEADKNIIFESLPYSIRNELLIKMYDPIINNFKLFRYFENSEFIIRFVSLLKPMVCSKGDILVNEGDYIEDIILNNSGVISLDVCVDLNQQKKSIEKYLIKYNLGKSRSNFSTNKDLKKIEESPSNASFSFISAKLSQINTNNYLSINNLNDNNFIYKKTKKEKNLKFIKILYIRKKEYFGDVLMFLNEKSPLYVRVHSKKAELFLLKKTDVVKLSSDYPNIWNKMSEKSIFNFEQIRNIITRKLTNFCNFYGIQTNLLLIKRDTKHFLYSCPNYLMSIPNSIEDDSESQESQSSGTSKSKNTDNVISESEEHFESENNSKVFTIIEEKSIEESNSNTNLKNNKNSIVNMNQNLKCNIISNNKSLSTFSKQTKKIEHSCSFKNKNNSIENQNQNDTNSNITIISNNNSNYLSPFVDKKILNSVSSSIIDNSSNVSEISLSRKKAKKKTKSSDYCFKKKLNKSIHATCSHRSNSNKSFENIKSFRVDQNGINDEIYSNEKFQIIFQEEDELMSKNIYKILSSKILEYDSQKKQKTISNKFNNLKISSSSNIEIKSSYENLNEFTNSRYIIDDNLRKKTKHFVGVECGFISQTSPSKFDKALYLNSRRESKPTKKLINRFKSRKSLDSSKFSMNNHRCLSYYKSDDVSLSIQPNETIVSKKPKNSNTIRKTQSFYMEKNLSKNVASLKQTSSIKSKNYSRRTYKKKSIVSDSCDEIPKKKNKKKNELSSDKFVRKKTKRKMDLISENMQRDRQNLNNPNEFYAGLFSNFVVNNRQKNASGMSNSPMNRMSRYDEES